MNMKARFFTSLEQDAIARLQTVAEAAHTDATKFAAIVLGRFSDLRPECALDAIASIPKEYFKRGPGRPANLPERPAESNG